MRYEVLDLFAGIGGFSLAAESSGLFRTAAFCEIEPYAQRVLRRHWPDVPIFDDVKELTADALADAMRPRRRKDARSAHGDEGEDAGWCEANDNEPHRDGEGAGERMGRDLVLTAGFPCQDISYAGKGAGLAGERSGLFFEVARLADELRPDYLLLENVAALVTRGLDAVLGTLASLGFDCVWACIPACAVGAPHRRDRIWILATPTTDESAERLQRIYGRVIASLTPFGDLSHGWPTATASDAWASEHNRSQTIPCNGRVLTGKAGLGLGQAARGETWLTPTSRDFKDGGYCENVPVNALLGRAVWPTPHANAHTGAGSHGDGGDNLQTAVGGLLNPDWVETLMGYPIGYTLTEGEPLRELPNVWPAGLGAPQHAWEPPRLTTVKENRAARLKALGNSIVPQVAARWFAAISEE